MIVTFPNKLSSHIFLPASYCVRNETNVQGDVDYYFVNVHTWVLDTKEEYFSISKKKKNR